MTHAISWFEIPVADLPRAQAFYERILGQPLKPELFQGTPNAIFPFDKGVGGALVKMERRKPSTEGALVYLDCHGELEAVLARVAGAGGKVLLPRTDIGPPGFIAIIQDSEGNSVGLHSERPGGRG
jgi:predicted enzyme related to lactoylglutathione lyase